MSAIYGCVGLQNSLENTEQDLKYFKNYTFDRQDSCTINQVSFSCFIQEFTLESKSEILPYYHEEMNCLITADAIIDNRLELCEKLDVDKKISISDSQLILKSYELWGYDFPKYLYGSFAVAIYNFNTNELILVRDHLGDRSLYYNISDKYIKFSTLERPICKKGKYNENFLRRFLAISFVLDDVVERETAYEDVLYVEPAEMIIFKDSNISRMKYWELKTIKSKSSTEEEIVKLKSIFEEAIKCRIRTEGTVGVKLSGGLDSNAVAYIAASLLSNEGKKLYSYTSVIDPKYNLRFRNHIIADESQLANMIKSKFSNVKTKSLVSDKLNTFNVIENCLDIFEQPYKFLSNSYWLLDICENAAKDKCKVLLNGQFGNFTLSYDNITNHLYRLFLKFKWIKFYKEFNYYCKGKKISRKKMLKSIFKNSYNNKAEKSYFNPYALLDAEERNIIDNFFHNKFSLIRKPIKNNISLKIFMSSAALNHIGSVETKFGLKYNLINRDPFKDVRLIEKCYNLPIDVYNSGGTDRNLIKIIMKNILPNEILDTSKIGIQAADWINRLESDWQHIYSSLKKKLGSLPEGLIDKKIFNEYFEKYNNNEIINSRKTEMEIRNIFVVYLVALWLDDNKQ